MLIVAKFTEPVAILRAMRSLCVPPLHRGIPHNGRFR